MKPKHLPRLWCALQGVLPLEVRAATPHDPPAPTAEQKRPVLLPSNTHRRSVRVRLSET